MPRSPTRSSSQLRAATTPLASLAAAYRAWALDHPHLYRLMMDRPLPREHLAPGLEDRAAAALVAAAGGDPDAARAAFAFAHGMVVLELNDRFRPTPTLLQPGVAASLRSVLRGHRRRA